MPVAKKHVIPNPRVGGSSPAGGTTKMSANPNGSGFAVFCYVVFGWVLCTVIEGWRQASVVYRF